jgi:hypothetical protein
MTEVNNNDIETDVINLWDDKRGFVKSGISYGNGETDEIDEETEEGYGLIIGEDR